MKMFVAFFFVTLVAISAAAPSRGGVDCDEWGPYYRPGDACYPGEFFYSKCNSCRCNEDGSSAVCTKMSCDTEAYENSCKPERSVDCDKWGPYFRPGDVCYPGEFFYSECNSCRCNEDGSSAVCTRMLCNTEEYEKFCKPKKSIDCSKEWGPFFVSGRDRCTPNEGFCNECRYCTCGPDGRTAFCTFQACPQPSWSPWY